MHLTICLLSDLLAQVQTKFLLTRDPSSFATIVCYSRHFYRTSFLETQFTCTYANCQYPQYRARIGLNPHQGWLPMLTHSSFNLFFKRPWVALTNWFQWIWNFRSVTHWMSVTFSGFFLSFFLLEDLQHSFCVVGFGKVTQESRRSQ